MPSKDKSGITKYTHVEHVLKVSDTYVGSMEKTEEEHWVYNQEENKMEKRKITYTPGEYKIFDEIEPSIIINPNKNECFQFSNKDQLIVLAQQLYT